MQIIINILAVIGALTIFEALALVILILLTERSNKGSENEHMNTYCALTGERCYYDTDEHSCVGCPIAEEAEKIGDR